MFSSKNGFASGGGQFQVGVFAQSKVGADKWGELLHPSPSIPIN